MLWRVSLSNFSVAYLDRKQQDFARLRCIERVIQELKDAILGTLQVAAYVVKNNSVYYCT